MSATLGVPRRAPVAPSEAAELTSELYAQHGQRVFTFCYSRLRDREEAQDAAQTTFIYALRSIQRGVVPEFELAWLLKIAFNVCRSTRRSLGRRPTSSEHDVSELADPTPGPTAERNEQLAALRGALGTLPGSQQRAILMREWQGLSYAEIADELALSVKAVETLLFRARRNLTARLKGLNGALGALDLGSALTVVRSLLPGATAKAGAVAASLSIAFVPLAAEDGLRAEMAQPKVVQVAGRGPVTGPERKSIPGPRPAVKQAVLARTFAPTKRRTQVPPAGSVAWDEQSEVTTPPSTPPAAAARRDAEPPRATPPPAQSSRGLPTVAVPGPPALELPVSILPIPAPPELPDVGVTPPVVTPAINHL